MKNNVSRQNDVVHVSFEIGMLLKGIQGLAEIIGGISMLFITPNRLGFLTRLLTKHELLEDPRDKVANLLLSLSNSFSVSAQHFAVFYLISHGVIKCILIFLLWRRKLWAYPLAIISLILFIAYQIYHYMLTPSVFLILLSVFDVVMIGLTYLEYKRIKSTLKA